MADSYWRDRTLRRLSDAEAAAENARALRVATLVDALYAVREHDDEVLDEKQRDILRQAQQVAADLHAIW